MFLFSFQKMGCNKSKHQYEESQTHINDEQINPWELGQEPHSYFNESFEFNQNVMSDVGFHPQNLPSCRPTGDQCRAYPNHPTGYGYTNVNATGSFGDAAPSYSLNSRFNAYNIRVDGSASSNIMYNNNFNEERFQYRGGFDRDQLCGDETVMGPPLRAMSRPSRGMSRVLRPVARCRSLSDDFRRAPRSAHFNTIARHRSLENIPNAFRMRNSRINFSSDGNLSRSSSVSNEEYPRSFNQNRLNCRRLGQQRGLKRNSWDDDSLSSSISCEQTTSGGGTSDSPEAQPRIKRRPSDVDDLDSNQSNDNTSKKVTDNDDIDHDDPSIMDNSVDRLNISDEAFDILDLLLFPEEWSSCAVDKTGLVNIALNSLEGKSVLKYFSRTSQSKDFKLSITALARVENPFMHSHYLLKKQEMESRNDHVDELYLYHGTKKEHLSSILEDNLNWRLYSEKHRFGQGVSFSPLATYSSHYSDKSSEKVMLLFKVLASNSIGGSPDMKVPPITDEIVYDTSIKDDTTVIVKYSDNEFYPLYKITYLKVMRN
jgi:hypothetical protein